MNKNPTTGRTFEIPEVNLPKFEADMAKLVKRADKLGVPAPIYTVIDKIDRTNEGGLVTRCYAVIVSGEAPKYDGWRFIAVIDLDREHPEAPNVVNAITGIEVDPAWREAPDYCDHCKSHNRGRKKLVVVEHDEGARQIVGSTCLHDFLGHLSPAAIAAWAEILATLDERAEGYEKGSGGEWRSW